MACIGLTVGASVLWFGAVAPVAADANGAAEPAVLVTVAGRSGALPGASGASVKVTPLAEYPAKRRATGGVRCHRFLKGEDSLVMAWIGSAPIVGPTEGGIPVDLSGMEGKRDGSGTQLTSPLAIVGSTRRVHVQ
jgi:DNA gyrase subunit A